MSWTGGNVSALGSIGLGNVNHRGSSYCGAGARVTNAPVGLMNDDCGAVVYGLEAFAYPAPVSGGDMVRCCEYV